MTAYTKKWKDLETSFYGQGILTGSGGVTTEFYSEGEMTSERHPRFDSYPPYRSGGNWYLHGVRHVVTPAEVNYLNPSGIPLYQGKAITRHHMNESQASIASNGTLDSLGATGMSRVLPTNPSADLLVGLAEVYREGVPKMLGSSSWKARTINARSAGSDYLNYQFGWAPLISEIRDVITATKNAEKILSRYLTDSGKVIHRRYDFPDVIETTVVDDGGTNGFPSQASISWAGSTQRTITTKCWFEGAFMYHIPIGNDTLSTLRRNIQLFDKLYGVTLSPEVIWNLAPWSWAIDWFTNTGDVMHNISALGQDGLAMLYGYMMWQQERKFVTTGRVTLNGKTYYSRYESVFYTKQRRTANPYGFGSQGLALTKTRAAVVAALLASFKKK